jgi:hypothetical protein
VGNAERLAPDDDLPKSVDPYRRSCKSRNEKHCVGWKDPCKQTDTEEEQREIEKV